MCHDTHTEINGDNYYFYNNANRNLKGTDRQTKQFVNKVLKTRYIGFVPSERHTHGRVTVEYAIVGELFSR